MLLASDGMRLRRMLNPAPLPVPNNRSSACCRAAPPRLRIEFAWPKASETPKPSIAWYVVPPLITTVDAALAGSWLSATTEPAPARTAVVTAASRMRYAVRDIEASGQRTVGDGRWRWSRSTDRSGVRRWTGRCDDLHGVCGSDDSHDRYPLTLNDGRTHS